MEIRSTGGPTCISKNLATRWLLNCDIDFDLINHLVSSLISKGHQQGLQQGLKLGSSTSFLNRVFNWVFNKGIQQPLLRTYIATQLIGRHVHMGPIRWNSWTLKKRSKTCPGVAPLTTSIRPLAPEASPPTVKTNPATFFGGKKF